MSLDPMVTETAPSALAIVVVEVREGQMSCSKAHSKEDKDRRSCHHVDSCSTLTEERSMEPDYWFAGGTLQREKQFLTSSLSGCLLCSEVDVGAPI